MRFIVINRWSRGRQRKKNDSKFENIYRISTNIIALYSQLCVCMCVYVCVCLCVFVSLCLCVCVCVCVCVYVCVCMLCVSLSPVVRCLAATNVLPSVTCHQVTHRHHHCHSHSHTQQNQNYLTAYYVLHITL